ncbi:hypothetical protein PIIN_08178 [Serendipita indica DSM 11827]|uniref:DUF6593 domain-containing protein n=1 Tax=Serendipita indica (strain DSM 11827) TaxID=1109443 RepID=G4TSD2_SERID|nr:hypothetical protein PIIN_08178 [Serendipita indica DSM 11827]
MALEHPRLIFSSNSLRHTTLACDSLGIHYEIKETDTGDVGVTRWDKQTNNQVPVGEYSIHIFKSPKIRFPGGDWEALDTFLHKDGWFFTHDRTFTGQGGTKYRWKHKLAGLTLFHVDDDKEPVVHYVRHSMSHEKSYLEILDKTVLDVLDKIVCDFILNYGEIASQFRQRCCSSVGYDWEVVEVDIEHGNSRELLEEERFAFDILYPASPIWQNLSIMILTNSSPTLQTRIV